MATKIVIAVDRVHCDGCMNATPDIFDLDDEGKVCLDAGEPRLEAAWCLAYAGPVTAIVFTGVE